MVERKAPDRRPLLNIVVGVLILVVAGALFWPRGGGDGPPAEDSLVLTPSGESDDDQSTLLASSESVETDDAGADTEAMTESDAPAEVPTEAVAADRFPVEDATLDETPQETEPVKQAPAKTPARRSVTEPGANGRWYLVVGSFGQRDNAESLVSRLSGAGVPAVSVPADGNGGVVHRVRVGYFSDRADAEAFGRNLKSDMQLDYWVASR